MLADLPERLGQSWTALRATWQATAFALGGGPAASARKETNAPHAPSNARTKEATAELNLVRSAPRGIAAVYLAQRRSPKMRKRARQPVAERDPLRRWAGLISSAI